MNPLSSLMGWASLGAGISILALGALCWHRGNEIDDLKAKLAVEKASTAVWVRTAGQQSDAITRLQADATARQAQADTAITAATGLRQQHEQAAMQIMAKPVTNDCKAVEQLIDDWQKERVK